MNPKPLAPRVDVLIIGAGLGGLTLGALFCLNSKKRVLILEQNAKIGGCTHAFTRHGNYQFDVGVHYVFGAEESGPLRKALERLTQGRLTWKRLPSEFDTFAFPGRHFKGTSDLGQFFDRLCADFPNEVEALKLFAKLLPMMESTFYHWLSLELLPWWMAWPLKTWTRLRRPLLFLPTQKVLDRLFGSSELKAILCGRWPSLGILPSESHFGIFAADMMAMSRGAYFPTKGGDQIAAELATTVVEHRGEIRTRTEVLGLKIKDGVCFGVETSAGTIEADLIVSSVGSYVTYEKLLKQPSKLRTDHSLSFIIIFLELTCSPSSIGIDTSNVWIYADTKFSSFDGMINNVWLSSPSQKRGDKNHTLEIGTLVQSSLFADWEESKWRDRPEEYDVFKKDLFRRILAITETHFPGLERSIKHYEIGTPLTAEHFIRRGKFGAGVPAAINRLNSPLCRPSTPVANFYLTGSDVFSWGVPGAILGAFSTYRLATGGRRPSNLNWLKSL